MHWLYLWQWIVGVLNGNNPNVPGQVAVYALGVLAVIWRVERKDHKAGRGLREEIHDAELELFHPAQSAEDNVAREVERDLKPID